MTRFGFLPALITGLVLLPAQINAAQPDLSGTWLPVDALASPWPEPLPLTAEARQRFETFDPDRDEPTGFCMPQGTPRNTLAGTGPMEVLQTADRVYFVFQPNLTNAETRRVYLDGRARPPQEDRIPSWMGMTRGQWDGNTLVAETTDIEPQAILSAKGLSHGGKLVVRERWHLARDNARGEVLVNDMVLDDAATFTKPVSLRRVFVRAPDAQLVEGQCSERLWIDRIWKHRLGEHADARRKNPPAAPAAQEGAR